VGGGGVPSPPRGQKVGKQYGIILNAKEGKTERGKRKEKKNRGRGERTQGGNIVD